VFSSNLFACRLEVQWHSSWCSSRGVPSDKTRCIPCGVPYRSSPSTVSRRLSRKR